MGTPSSRLDKKYKVDLIEKGILSLSKAKFNAFKERMKDFYNAVICKRSTSRNHFIHANGMKVLSKKLDIIKIVESLDRLKTASKILLRDH